MDDRKRWQETRNLLCIRLDSMGDVMMTSPALRALRETGTGRRVTLLTSPAGAALAPLIPVVDETIVYQSPWMKATPQRADSQMDTEMIARLKMGGFDGAVIFTVFSQNPLPAALMCYLADIPLRAGYCHENPYQLLTDWVPDPEPQSLIRHEVRRQLDLVKALGFTAADERLVLSLPAGAQKAARERIERIGMDPEKKWLVIHPGASAPSRRYPVEGFGRAAEILANQHGFQILFTGTSEEIELVESIRRQIHRVPTWSLAGCLSLEDMAGVLALTPALITNNTGPAHLAAALGTKIIDLYALTNPQHAPWMAPHRLLFQDVPCKFCYKSVCPLGHHHCLTLVPPEAIVAATLKLIESSNQTETRAEVLA